MFNKRALIIGITGQDGPYLAKFLVGKGYKVFGGYRRSSTRNFWRLHYLDVRKDVELVPLELLDQTSILSAIQTCQPDEIYNLAAQSFVGFSFEEAIALNIDLNCSVVIVGVDNNPCRVCAASYFFKRRLIVNTWLFIRYPHFFDRRSKF